jgi:hypothetical protein
MVCKLSKPWVRSVSGQKIINTVTQPVIPMHKPGAGKYAGKKFGEQKIMQ